MKKPANTVWHHATVTRKRREKQNNHKSLVMWFTGLPASGKSTLAHAVEENLHQRGCRSMVLDGDNIRHGLCEDLGFTEEDRREHLRRVGEVIKLFVETGVIILAAFVSPFREGRQMVRSFLPSGDFVEIYCKCALEVCEARDKKRLYKRAKEGKVSDFTGISSPYEEPENPELIIETGTTTLEESVDKVIRMMELRGAVKLGE